MTLRSGALTSRATRAVATGLLAAPLAGGLLLVGVGVLLVLVGKIDRSGTIGIIGSLIGVGGAFLVPLAAVRAVVGRLT